MTLNDVGLIEFIEALRENRCLWDPSDASYTNRAMRKAAQTALLNIFQKYDPNASIASVRRKIDTLRTTYQRERRKLELNENVSSTSDAVYVPTLWYYDHLNFLSEAYKVSKSGSDSPVSLRESFLEDDVEEKQETRQQSSDDVIGLRPPPPKTIKRKRINAQTKLIATEKLANTLETGSMDSWEAFGLSVGGDLRHLEGNQQTIAQKLISDVIYLAKMGRLSEGSTVGDIPLRLASPSPSASSNTSPTPACSASGQLSPYQEVPSTIQQTTFSDPSKYSLLKVCESESKYYFSKPQIFVNDPMNIPLSQQQPEQAPSPHERQEVMNES